MRRLAPILAALALCAASVTGRAEMTTSRAVAVILNSKSASDVKTFAAAKAQVEREARAGKPLQQFVIGVTTDDKALAKKYLAASREVIRKQAEKTDNPLAWYLLSLERNDFGLLRRAAAGGNVQALNALGTIATQEAISRRALLSTNGVQQILRQSYDYFNQAAAKGDSNGYINLGACYLRGLGCKQDMGLAFTCFKAAAEAGHPEGMDNMSACYQFGHGIRRDDELSLYWGMRGRAARGDEAAARWLREHK